MRKLTLAAAIAAFVVTGACKKTGEGEYEVQKPTVGQQLIDLQKANATGALSDAEYAKKRKEVIDAALASP